MDEAAGRAHGGHRLRAKELQEVCGAGRRVAQRLRHLPRDRAAQRLDLGAQGRGACLRGLQLCPRLLGAVRRLGAFAPGRVGLGGERHHPVAQARVLGGLLLDLGLALGEQPAQVVELDLHGAALLPRAPVLHRKELAGLLLAFERGGDLIDLLAERLDELAAAFVVGREIAHRRVLPGELAAQLLRPVARLGELALEGGRALEGAAVLFPQGGVQRTQLAQLAVEGLSPGCGLRVLGRERRVDLAPALHVGLERLRPGADLLVLGRQRLVDRARALQVGLQRLRPRADLLVLGGEGPVDLAPAFHVGLQRLRPGADLGVLRFQGGMGRARAGDVGLQRLRPGADLGVLRFQGGMGLAGARDVGLQRLRPRDVLLVLGGQGCVGLAPAFDVGLQRLRPCDDLLVLGDQGRVPLALTFDLGL
jgi:hypothetical protein